MIFIDRRELISNFERHLDNTVSQHNGCLEFDSIPRLYNELFAALEAASIETERTYHENRNGSEINGN